MIKKLTNKNLEDLINFINNENDFQYFINLGWSFNELKNHFKKKNNFSICYYEADIIKGILVGNTIPDYDKNELEIHILYVASNSRRNKIALKLINFIENSKILTNINKIYIEVSEDNTSAIKFYEKNNFVFSNFRHSYYIHNKKKLNAKCFYKKI